MRINKTIGAAAVIAATLLAGSAFAAPVATMGAKAALAAKTLDLPSMLAFAMQDERLARAEYNAILGKFGTVRPFSNIVGAEGTHIGWIESLYAVHNLAKPADATPAPTASRDWAAALEAGKQAEIDNIAMYDRFLTQDLPADVRQVFLQLRAASENDLRAFTGNAGGRG